VVLNAATMGNFAAACDAEGLPIKGESVHSSSRDGHGPSKAELARVLKTNKPEVLSSRLQGEESDSLKRMEIIWTPPYSPELV
jgi:hypothetical protein